MMEVWNDEYRIRQMDLPYTVKAMVSMGEDGFYNVYVNSRLSQEAQFRAAAHELAHIAKDDFYNGNDIRAIEGA